MAKAGKKRVDTDEAGQIGQRIRAARVAAGLSQEALGDKLGVSFQQIQKNEKGINRVPSDRLKVIATTLGVSAASLLGIGEDTKKDGHSEIMDVMTTTIGVRLARAFLVMEIEQRYALVNFVETLIIA